MAAFEHSLFSPRHVLPIVGVWTAAVFTMIPAGAQEPVIQRIESETLQPGGHATLLVHGSALKNAVKVWTPFASFFPKAGHDPNADALVSVEADVPADTSVGIYPARMITPGGCSAAAFVVVDDLPSHRPSDGTEVRTTAPAIPLPCSITGQISPAKSRFYKLTLSAGQPLTIDVFARRLNSALDPAVRITDPQGQEIAFCDDVPGFDGDARVHFAADEAGDYLLELRDIKYTGGPGHAYHLRIGNFPSVAATSPRIALPSGPVTLIGPDGQPVGEVPALAAGADAAWTTAVWKPADSDGSSISSMVRNHGVSQSEVEPNEQQDQATVVPDDARFVTGRFHKAHDADWYRLTAAAPGPICLTVHTRDVGSPADVVLQLHSADGKKIGEADDNGPLDAQLTASLPAAGDYFLKVSELAGLGGAEWTYDIEVSRTGGRIEITAPADRVNIPRGGTASLVMTVKRINLDGPILLTAEGLPESIRCEPVWLAAKQSTVAFTLTSIGNEPQPGDSGPLRIAASTPAQETLPSVPVLLAPRPVQSKPGDAFQTSRVRADFFVAVGAPAQYSLSAAAPAGPLVPGTSLTIPIRAVRTEAWTTPIDLALSVPADQLPPGIKIDAIKLEGAEAVLTVSASADAAIGRFSVFAQGTSKKEKDTVIQPLPVIGIEVAAAVAVPAATENPAADPASGSGDSPKP